MTARAQTSPSRLFQRFFETEAAGAALLLFSAAVALIASNSARAEDYRRFWSTSLAVGFSHHSLSLSLHQWIGDGLMTVFFLLMGLEIKRELIDGELSSPAQAVLPMAGAVGGMALPVVVYVLANHGGAGIRGWGIPMATDIAFALGALALIAPAIPAGAKVFLAALAIADDMGAVAVIAFFYRHALDGTALLRAALAFVALIGLNVGRVRHLGPYLLLGALLWLLMHQSGIHPTLAGVLLASTIPTPPLLRLERALHGFSAFVVMPLFALSNAGVAIRGSTLSWPVLLGVAIGLALGKPLGIAAASFGAVALEASRLPKRVTWTTLVGCGCLGGIGFTMSLFIAHLAFENGPLLDSAKLGILAGSVAAGVAGGVALRVGRRRFAAPEE
jgi:Na+:H+ antiporter, NhaA family